MVFGIGVAVVAALAVGLFTMRNFGRRIIVALPLPHQLRDLYDRFEEGVFGALVPRQLPILGLLTALIWLTEGLRLYLVVQALGFPDVYLGLSGAIFVALIGSLLTAVPLSPAGLGIVEAGVVGVLTIAYGVPLPEATAIALLDRVISVFSIIVFGSIAYALSSKPRGLGRIGGARGRSGDAPRRPDSRSRTRGSAPDAIGNQNDRAWPVRPSCTRNVPATPVLHPCRRSRRTLVMADLAPGHCDGPS